MNIEVNYKKLIEIFKNDTRLNQYIKPNPNYLKNLAFSGYVINEPYLLEPQEYIIGQCEMIDVFDILINKKIKKLYLNKTNTAFGFGFILGIVTDNSTFYYNLLSDAYTHKKISFTNLKNIINKNIVKIDFEQKEKNQHHIIDTYIFTTDKKELFRLSIDMTSTKKRIVSYNYKNCCVDYCGFNNCCCSCDDNSSTKKRTWATHKPFCQISRFITDKINSKDLLRCHFDIEKEEIKI